MKRELQKKEIRRLASRPFGTLSSASVVLREVCKRLSCLKKASSSLAGRSTASMKRSTSASLREVEECSLKFSSTLESYGKSCTSSSYKLCKASTT